MWCGTALKGCMSLAVMLIMVVTAQSDAAPQLDRNSSTADHSRFTSLQGPFNSGPEVTEACLKCHTEAAEQIQQSLHWTWEYEHPVTGQMLGKRHVINSFCGSVTSNEPRCTSCHVGYDWKDMKQPPPQVENKVDCLVCHDTTGQYAKLPAAAGHPAYSLREVPPGSGKVLSPPDLAAIARKVGSSGRQNCGACHFNGGGADGVKHGDLDSSLITPPFSLDVHMSSEGADLSCADCHTTTAHSVTGSRYLTNARDSLGIDVPGHTDMSRASCESCHGFSPHEEKKINEHVDRVACQSCHIPAFARGGVATKTWWDWSTAGRLDETGQPIKELDDNGHPSYFSTKGDFRHGENVVPEYRWFNGVVQYTLKEEKLDVAHPPVEINKIGGSAADASARIWPFKIMHGKQPYDRVHHTLLVTHVFSPDDDSALWSNFSWPKALKAGAEQAGQPFSGDFGFVETKMYWPITHMVAPAADALTCQECHARSGRMDAITGVYIPGRDRSISLDTIGWGAALLVLAGSLLHASGRILMTVRRRKTK